jgi:hypothetical protein
VLAVSLDEQPHRPRRGLGNGGPGVAVASQVSEQRPASRATEIRSSRDP